VTLQDVQSSTLQVTERLDENFFRVRFDRLTPGEKLFLRMMAGLGTGPHKLADISKEYNISISTLSPTRSHLIKKGMIYSPSYGNIAFTVPLFNEFMLREMPFLES
jgi:hypothetical protein